jgi:UDPglucose--hexose-1-phosphate uridylyltransferase
MTFADTPHRRYNPLKDEWVLVSPHRSKRPWQGQVEAPDISASPSHDPGCYLCAGNERAGGVRNPDYNTVFVFENDFAALLPGIGDRAPPDLLLQSQSANGTCRVLCFSPDHGKSLPELALASIRAVVDSWCAQEAELAENHAYVQIFENKGATMGCSSPHPHGQIWATSYVPVEAEREDRLQREWMSRQGVPMLAQLVERELDERERIVCVNEDWLAIVPYWAAWPFETLLLPRFDVQKMAQLGDTRRTSLAAILKRLTTAYDNLFQTSFPYSMGWHGAPSGLTDVSHWRLHAHFYPPLLRSASVRKFMVGFEMLAETQRDLTPESAAARLREQSETHYRSFV